MLDGLGCCGGPENVLLNINEFLHKFEESVRIFHLLWELQQDAASCDALGKWAPEDVSVKRNRAQVDHILPQLMNRYPFGT